MEGDFQFQLSDMQGRPLRNQAINSGKAFYKVDIQNISAGMYYLELFNAKNSIHRQKIIALH